jgi:chaperonin GroEL
MSEQMGYSPKDLHFDESAREKLLSGVAKMSKAVKSTLGPSGNTVLIESPNHTHGITVTKDGVTVARSIDLLDPVENLAVKIMKEAADRTATNAGDGTTTAIVLTEALVTNGAKWISNGLNRTQVLRDMVEVTGLVVDNLKKQSIKVSNKTLLDVATISANNDKSIGKIISDVYREVGRNGVVTIERSQNDDTYAETTTGVKVGRGYSSPMFINDQKKDECVFEDVFVLVSDAEIHNVLQIESILKPIIQEGKKLLIIAPCGANVLNTLAANVVKNKIKICVIQPPSFGYRQHELMHDIAVSVGATYFSEKTGDDLSIINFSDLGHAAKIIVGKSETVVIKSELKSKEDEIKERVEQIRAAYANAKKKSDKDFLLERIASLTGGIGVIYVGGNTDLEHKELYDRIDDAVCAVRSAIEEGILPGGGKALVNTELLIPIKDTDSKEMAAAKTIVLNAVLEPCRQILENSGYDFDTVYPYLGDKPRHGMNVKTGEMGDLIQMGIIDPLKVTRSAIQNAVSVAVTILSTNAIVTMARSYETTNL